MIPAPHGRRRRRTPAAAVLLTALTVTIGACGSVSSPTPAHAQATYLALGDSYAFGYSTPTGTPVNSGNNGYAALFDQALASQNGGTAPTLVNLARPGETLYYGASGQANDGTFANVSTNPNGVFNYNTTYAGGGYTQSQQALLNTYLANPTFDANVRWVTVEISGNDFIGLLQSPTFQNADPGTQESLLNATLSGIQSNLSTLLTNLSANLPNAQIYLLGYPDAFAAGGSAYPEPYSHDAILATNSVFASLAGATPRTTFIDLYTPFAGKESTLTLYDDPNNAGDFHPSAAGYQVIANELTAAASPEPSSAGLIVLPLLVGPGMLRFARRRRRRGQVYGPEAGK